MFKGWENYYLLLGGASGSLIGLLFIVATLTSGRDRDQSLRGASIYTTPTVFHLGVVLTISAVVMAPSLGLRVYSLALALAGLIGLLYSATVAVRIARVELTETPHWSDFWCYGVAPLAIYLGLGACAVPTWAAWPQAPLATGAALLLLMLTTIRNAWDLVTWLAARPGPPQ